MRSNTGSGPAEHEKESGGQRKRGGEPRRGGQSESPTGGPSQTPDGKPLDRDPTEEGSAGRTPSR
jgi:hypothetical protein